MAKMTKDQALTLLEKQVAKVAQAGIKRVEEGVPKLKAVSKKVADEVKTGQSADMLETLVRQLKLVMRPVAEGVTLIDEAVKRLNEAEKNEEVFELAADEIAEGMKELTGPLEKARKELLAAKQQVTAAEKKMTEHGRDNASAEREWAGVVAEFDRKVAAAKKEFQTWQAYETDAQAALKAREKNKLVTLQKAKPASEFLDEIGAMKNSTEVTAAFAKEFDVDGLSKELQKQIATDKDALSSSFVTAKFQAGQKAAIDKRVSALAIEPRDGRKALTLLGLPTAALAKVQAALDGPDAPRAKLIATIAKQFKVHLLEKDVNPKLVKGGVL